MKDNDALNIRPSPSGTELPAVLLYYIIRRIVYNLSNQMFLCLQLMQAWI